MRPPTSFRWTKSRTNAAKPKRWGATEVCIQGGLPRNLPPFYYRDILRAVKAATPKMHCHAFSPMEMVYGVELTGMPVREYLLMLKDDGLDTLPGTAAEILDDDVRHVLSRNKLSSAQWREVIETAHQCGIRSTSTMMYGHSETPEQWVNQMLLLREIQSRTGGFTEFVPLGFIHDNTLLFAQGLARAGGTLDEHMKVHALARLMLAGSINHIQVSWVKLGREVSQLVAAGRAPTITAARCLRKTSRGWRARRPGSTFRRRSFRNAFSSWAACPAQRNTIYTQYTYPAQPLVEPVAAAAPHDRYCWRHGPGRIGTGAALGARRRVGDHWLARWRAGAGQRPRRSPRRPEHWAASKARRTRSR